MTTETETPTEYTPSTAEIREYVEVGGEPRPWMPPEPAMDEARAAAFDRWLAAHDREVAARALRAAARAWQVGGWADDLPTGDRPALIVGMAQRAADWMRARATRIENGETDD